MTEAGEAGVSKRLSVACNAAAFAMYADDGREITESEGGNASIELTPEETERARAVAKAVLDHVESYEALRGVQP